MKPRFSFCYNGRQFMPEDDGAIWNIDDRLTVSLLRKDFPEFKATHWILNFANKGDRNSDIISDIWDANLAFPFKRLPLPEPQNGHLPRKGSQCVTSMQGMISGNLYYCDDVASAKEYAPYDMYFRPWRGTVKYANTGSRSSEGTAPFFDIKGVGGGAIVAIGWTGAWRAETEADDDSISFRSGLQNARFYLKPGESVRTTSTLVMEYCEDDDAPNMFRRLIRKHFSHRATTGSSREGLLAFELWGGMSTASMIQRIQELKAHGIAFEDLWIDAAWYGQCLNCDNPFNGGWARYTGDWSVNSESHPDSLEDVRDAAAEAGMRPMIWFEPERALSNLPVPIAHPDWFMKPDMTGIDPDRPVNWILNYGNDDAKNYALEMLSNYIRKLNMSCYRQDFNVSLTEYFERMDEPDRRGITEIRHICGMYSLWDELHRRFPELIIDNCSGGGRRNDLETIQRSIPFFRTDYQCGFDANPEVIQVHNSNSMRVFPYIGCTTKMCDLYAMRSSYASSFGCACYNGIFQHMTEEDFGIIRKSVDEYRKIRQYFSCDFYNHGSAVFDTSAWAIWQYHDPETNSGIVMAFRRSESPFEQVTIALKGNLPEQAVATNMDTEKEETLAEGRLTIHLTEKRSSAIILYSNRKRRKIKHS